MFQTKLRVVVGQTIFDNFHVFNLHGVAVISFLLNKLNFANEQNAYEHFDQILDILNKIELD
jgi:hypothetical protein